MQRVRSLKILLRRLRSTNDVAEEDNDNSSTCSGLTRWSPTPVLDAACDEAEPMASDSNDNKRGANVASAPVEAAPAGPCWLLGAKYTFTSLINRGGQASVVKAVDNATREVVAVKLVPRRRVSIESVTRELVNHAALQSHPHIVGMREAFLTPDHLAVVMDYADRGDLAEHLSRHVYSTGGGMSEDAARRIFQQLVSALDWLHRAGVASRDVKCDNVLLSGPDASVKLADFGWSCTDQVDGPGDRRLCGTPEYMSTEVLRRRPGAGSQPSDVWAAGVTLWALVGGGFPFLKPAEERLDRAGRIRAMAPRIVLGCTLPMHAQISPELADLLRRMLEIDPATRITIAEVGRHPWVTRNMPRQLVFLNEMLEVARKRANAAAVAATVATACVHSGGCKNKSSSSCGGSKAMSSSSSSNCSGGGTCTARTSSGSGSCGSDSDCLPAAAIAGGGRSSSWVGSSLSPTSSCRLPAAAIGCGASRSGLGGCGSSGSSTSAASSGRKLVTSVPLAVGIRQSADDLRALVREAARGHAIAKNQVVAGCCGGGASSSGATAQACC